MQIVRTIAWVALFAVLLIFTIGNWDQRVVVRIWEGIVWETRLPAVVIVSFLLGLLPVWALHRATKWRMQRRIRTVENAARNVALSAPTPPLHPDPDPPAGEPVSPAEEDAVPRS